MQVAVEMIEWHMPFTVVGVMRGDGFCQMLPI